jgi:hypothetical protein
MINDASIDVSNVLLEDPEFFQKIFSVEKNRICFRIAESQESLTFKRRCFFIRIWNFVLKSLFHQGCQMVSFQTKNPNLGKFWKALDWKMLKYFRAIWNIFTDIWDILWPFGTFCVHLVHFSRFWYYVPRKIWQPCFPPSRCRRRKWTWTFASNLGYTCLDSLNAFERVQPFFCPFPSGKLVKPGLLKLGPTETMIS